MFYEMAKSEIKEIEKYISTCLSCEPKEVYRMLLPYILRGGKRIRPVLMVLCCKAVGGDGAKTIKPAGILEMFHNFSLIHDDIADSSQFRRGEPTLHVSHGIPIAMNSGDALYTLLLNEMILLDIEPAKLIRIEKMFLATFQKVVEGQGIELEWERIGRFDISEEEYLSMIDGKTSSLIGASCEMGALLGGADEKTCRRLSRFGKDIGAAFQIHDDVLNVTGTFEKYKKEIGGDITEGKRTLMVGHCLERCEPEEGEMLKKILSSHTQDKAEINAVIALFNKYGSIKYAKGKAAKFVTDAEAEISKLKESEEQKALRALCDYVISRES